MYGLRRLLRKASVGEAQHVELEKLLCTSEACLTELPVRVRPVYYK